MAPMAIAESEAQPISGGWVFAGALGYDFRELDVEQADRIAPFVVEAAWRRGLGPLLLIHGGDPMVAAVLRKQWSAGDWMAWSYHRGSKRHGTSATRILLALRSHASPSSNALPDLEPGCEDFDEPRCVGEVKAARPWIGEATIPGRLCGSAAMPDRPYCRDHDPLVQQGGL